MGALVTSNAEPYPFENENCTGELLALCRPTYDKALDKSGNYPYSDHFQNRRRNWEIRVNFRVKHTVTDTLRFGVQLDQYAPVDPASRRIMGVVVAALRNVVGNAIYHSVGDDPRYTEGPLEKPTFVMPLWAFDQFIETPDGEEAPSLMDPNFVNLGVRRSTDRSAFIRRMHNLKMEPGFTYTFAFWGISHIMSVLDWKIRGVLPGWPIDFNKFCKAPPVGVVLYALKPDVPGEEAEHRHLESRKNYYFNMAFWSTMAPPSEDRLRQIEDQNNSSPAGKPAASPCTGEPLQAVAERKRAPAARRRQVPGWMCICGV